MTPEQITRNQHFLRALRANKLKARNRMRDDKGGRCCLCVALDTAVDEGFPIEDVNDFVPPAEMSEWYGWPNVNPSLFGGFSASNMNDGAFGQAELTHAEIADLFEKKFNIPKEDVK